MSEVVEVFAGLTDSEATVDVKIVDTTGFTRGDFEWRMKRHERFLSSMSIAAGQVPAAQGGTCIIR